MRTTRIFGLSLALAGLAACPDDGNDPPPVNVIDTDSVISAGAGPGGMTDGPDTDSGTATSGDDDDDATGDDDDDEPTAGDDDDDATEGSADTTGGAAGSETADDAGTGASTGTTGPPPLPTDGGEVPN